MESYFNIKSFKPNTQNATLMSAWSKIAVIKPYFTINHHKSIPPKNAKTINQLLKYQWIEAKIREVIIPITQNFPEDKYKKR